MPESIQRTGRGRFAPGQSGNPRGGQCKPRLMTQQRLERLFEKHGQALLDAALQRFAISDEVMSALLIFWGLHRLGGAGASLPVASPAAQ